jgi:hypothetical protein
MPENFAADKIKQQRLEKQISKKLHAKPNLPDTTNFKA